METNPLTLGQQIAAARQARGWSLATLAQRIGTNPTTVLGWERDAHIPKAPSLRRAAEALGVPPSDWLRAAGYLSADGDWLDPHATAVPEDTAPDADPLMRLTRALEAGPWPESICAAVYSLLASVAYDRRRAATELRQGLDAVLAQIEAVPPLPLPPSTTETLVGMAPEAPPLTAQDWMALQLEILYQRLYPDTVTGRSPRSRRLPE